MKKGATIMKNMIETKNLTKTYKAFTAVDHVSLHIKKGSIYGFLGPNGAGKSTTMKMLLGLTAPTDGEFQIDNLTFPNNRVQILKKIGSFIESPSFYPNLTGRENLDIIRRILGLPATSVDEALELVGLSEFGNRLAKKYSLGMKQRLGLASALLGEPPVLILDEPTNGLDPAGIHEIRNLIKSLPKRYDCTVLISSHMLSEIELLADDIGILNHGKLLFEGSLDDLKLTAHQAGFENDNLENSLYSKSEAIHQQIFSRFKTYHYKNKQMSFELRLAQIMYVESMNHKLIIHHDNGDFIERKNLSSFIKEIDSNNFIQIHKSFVINKNFIKEIKAKELILKDSTILPIGRNFKESI